MQAMNKWGFNSPLYKITTERGKQMNGMYDVLGLAQKYIEKAEANAEQNPTSEEIQIVIVEPNKKPYKKFVPNQITTFNDIVGGYIEIYRMGRKTPTGGELIITANEEGRRMRLPLNRSIIGLDMLVGTFFITAANMVGENVSIDDITANKLIKQFAPMEVYL